MTFFPNQPGNPFASGPPRPGQVERQRALATLQAEEYITARNLARIALKHNPRDAQSLSVLGQALMSLGEIPEAGLRLRQARAIMPNDGGIICALSELARIDGKHEEALKLAREAKSKSNEPRPWVNEAMILATMGKYEEAAEILRPKVTSGEAHLELLVAYADLCDRLKKREEGIDLLRKGMKQTAIAVSGRRGALYTLGRLLDREKRYDEAFDALERANSSMPEGHLVYADMVLPDWTPEAMAAAPRARAGGERAAIVLGMPRSGTTLLESVVCAHPKAGTVGESMLLGEIFVGMKPLGEMTQADADAIGKRYAEMLAREGDETSLRIVDKMPSNYQRVGMVQQFLPGARVVHAVRDARDVCLSIFTQNFGPRHTYSTRLESVATQYVEHLKFMEAWRERLEIDIHTLRYEDLVSDPETQTRALLDFLGMPFDERCLEFYNSKRVVNTASRDQVRQPLYSSSVGKWKHYEHRLGPMLDILREGGAIDD